MLTKRNYNLKPLQDTATVVMTKSDGKPGIDTVRLVSRNVVPFSLPVGQLTPLQLKFASSFNSAAKKRLSEAFESWQGCWLPLNSKLMKYLYGGSYKSKILNPLIKLGLLEVREKADGTQPYRPTKGDVRGFSKKYRLAKNLQDELLKGQVKILEREEKLSIKKLEKLIMGSRDRTDTGDKGCAITKACFDGLDPINITALLEDLRARVKNGEEINIELTLRKALMVNYKQANATRGQKSKRVYSTINHGGSKPLLPYLTVGGVKVKNLDFKALHIYLLAFLVKDLAARQKYLDFLYNDPYEFFINPAITDPAARKNLRRNIKTAWQKALANSCYGRPMAKVILKFLETEHPEVFRVIQEFAAAKKINRNNNIQCHLQKLEAGLMDEVLLTADFWRLTRHDSLLVRESDVPRALEMLHEVARRKIGYALKISVE